MSSSCVSENIPATIYPSLVEGIRGEICTPRVKTETGANLCRLDSFDIASTPAPTSEGTIVERLAPPAARKAAGKADCKKKTKLESNGSRNRNTTYTATLFGAGFGVAKAFTYATVGMASLIGMLPTAAADCPDYCTRSQAMDEFKIRLAGAACAELGPEAVVACSEAYRLGIEYDKAVCTAIGCGPFMLP